MIRAISTILILVLSAHLVNAQKFGAAIEVGFNAAQIDGDLFAGYNKVGLHAGVGVSYALDDVWNINSGIFYDALGSQKELQIGSASPEEQEKIQLSYISVPLTLSYNLSVGSSNSLSLYGGTQVGYLFQRKIQDRIDDEILDYFSNVDIGILLGVDYHLSEYWSIGIKATEAITLIFNNNKVTQLNANSLRNRYLTFSFKRHL